MTTSRVLFWVALVLGIAAVIWSSFKLGDTWPAVTFCLGVAAGVSAGKDGS